MTSLSVSGTYVNKLSHECFVSEGSVIADSHVCYFVGRTGVLYVQKINDHVPHVRSVIVPEGRNRQDICKTNVDMQTVVSFTRYQPRQTVRQNEVVRQEELRCVSCV